MAEVIPQKPQMPMTLQLLPDGNTLAVFYKDCRALVIAKLLSIMGEPESVCPGEYDPDVVMMVWPHQNMNQALRDAAEQMTDTAILSSIGYYP